MDADVHERAGLAGLSLWEGGRLAILPRHFSGAVPGADRPD